MVRMRRILREGAGRRGDRRVRRVQREVVPMIRIEESDSRDLTTASPLR